MSKFSSLALPVDQPARMTIHHPITRQPLRDAEGVAYVELYSADSEVARKHGRTVSRRRLAMRAGTKLTPEELEAEGVELLSVLTAGWRLLSLDGAALDVPFSQANARELYADNAMSWLREQVNEFAAERGNFFAAS